MSDTTIRLAQPSEYDAIGALTVDAYVAGGHLPAGHQYAASLADAQARAERATLLVAVDDDGNLLGSVTFCRYATPMAELSQPGEAEFRMLAVAADAQGRGVGEALVRACLDHARQHGDGAVVLSTQPTMRGAQRVYERLGFTRLPERDWYPLPEVPLLAYRRTI